MNVHHLELFYYVAKFEGITQAVRKMPYGIQQPAVSGQILQLERDLGVKLFHRRPFALTPAGEELYDYVYPFFSQLHQVASRLRGEESQHLRLAASATALTSHLPKVLEIIREEFPNLRITLKEASPEDVEVSLQKQESDAAISLLYKSVAPGIRAHSLLELPIILIGGKERNSLTFSQLAKKAVDGEIREPLIALPPTDTATKLFQETLGRKGLRWNPQVEVSTLELVQSYVANGFGYGITVDVPGIKFSPRVRRIPVEGVPPLVVGLLHMGDLKPVAKRFAELAMDYAERLSGREN